MCDTCLRGAGPRGRVVGCGHAGEPVILYISGRVVCPWGKHPRKDGTIRWLGVRWHGVPYPLRLVVWARARTHPRPSSFGGCGCVVELKSVWNIIAAAARGRRRGPVTRGALSHA